MNMATLNCWGYYQILNIGVSLSLALLLVDGFHKYIVEQCVLYDIVDTLRSVIKHNSTNLHSKSLDTHIVSIQCQCMAIFNSSHSNKTA